MEIKVWQEGMSDAESKDLAYWERNMLALHYADGWYYDNIPFDPHQKLCASDRLQIEKAGIKLQTVHARYEGWGRVLSIENGRMTFHIPDNFDVGNLKQIQPNWDGHTTKEKWERIARERGIKV